MQCHTNNKVVQKPMLNLLLMMMVTSVYSEVSVAKGNSQQLPHHALQLASGSNPWALPQQPENVPGFAPSPRYPNNQQNNQLNMQYPGFRFVTPEILESLKQQQMQTQKVPDDRQWQPYRSPRLNAPPQYMPPQHMLPQYMPPQSMQKPPQQNPFAYQPGRVMPDSLMPDSLMPGIPGMGRLNPLHDAPAVSPWGSAPDVMNQGGSSPWVPNAAIGGIPPMNILPFSDFGSSGFGSNDEAGYGINNYERKVFNPFTFAPNGNL